MSTISWQNKKSGFTLIELLVVISIISLLSVIIMASLNSARSKGRDSERLQSMRELRNALELYKSDHGSYPGSDGSIWGEYAPYDYYPSGYSEDGAGLNAALVVNKYISSLPKKDTNYNFIKFYMKTNGIQFGYSCGDSISDGTYDYFLAWTVENQDNKLPNTWFNDGSNWVECNGSKDAIHMSLCNGMIFKCLAVKK